MGGYVPKLVMWKSFVHPDGRKVLVYRDGDDGWIVELRPCAPAAVRPRWYPATEEESAATCWSIMQEEAGWEAAR